MPKTAVVLTIGLIFELPEGASLEEALAPYTPEVGGPVISVGSETSRVFPGQPDDYRRFQYPREDWDDLEDFEHPTITVEDDDDDLPPVLQLPYSA